MYHANNHKKADVAILISDKQILRQKNVLKVESHFIMVRVN